MPRYKQRDDVGFGSDSFLDIIANIVGILIILMVIAGVRVSNAPVLLRVSQGEPAPPPPRQIEVTEAKPVPLPVELEATPEPEPTPLVEPAPVPPPPPKLVARIAEIEREIAVLDKELKQAIANASAADEQLADLNNDLAAKRAALEQLTESAETDAGLVVELRRELNEQRQALAQLQAELNELEREPPETKRIEHKLTPVSKLVGGDERHYRLSENRVAEVPIAALTERLREQIERRKEWLLKFNRHRGEVGPVDGFTMKYLVQRNQSVLDELRYGRGVYRISVTGWQIEPTGDLRAEPAGEALRPGSRFYRSLVAAGRDTTLTFWVYPDSFGLFRKLQEFAHKSGFTVAGRPLPFGMPIAGSPNGSRSAGQ